MVAAGAHRDAGWRGGHREAGWSGVHRHAARRGVSPRCWAVRRFTTEKDEDHGAPRRPRSVSGPECRGPSPRSLGRPL